MDDEKEEKKVKAVLFQVRLIRATGKAALVEWVHQGKLNRAVVPLDAIQDGAVTNNVLAAAIPYGVAWEEIEFHRPSPAQIANALREAGIWTREDLFANPNKAIGVLQAIYGVDLGALIGLANKA